MKSSLFSATVLVLTVVATTASADPTDRYVFERRPVLRPVLERVVPERVVRPALERAQSLRPDVQRPVAPRATTFRPTVQRATPSAGERRTASEARTTALPGSRWGDLRALKAHIDAFVKNMKQKNDSDGR